MVNRSIEIKQIGLEVEKERQKSVMKKVKELYPNLEVYLKGDTVWVKGDLHNYKRRDMIFWVLSGGKHGKNVHAS